VSADGTEIVSAHMMQGSSLICDKSSLESLNFDEAVLLDNFYLSVITRSSSSSVLLIAYRLARVWRILAAWADSGRAMASALFVP
jgi:hypothetical protein